MASEVKTAPDQEKVGHEKLGQEKLASVVMANFPGAKGISTMRRISAGASMETWALDVEGTNDKLILRRAPGGFQEKVNPYTPTLEKEAAIIKVAHANGVLAPVVRYVLEPKDGIGRGYFMDRLEGETLARRILRDAEFAHARKVLARQCGETIAKLHQIPVDKFPELAVMPASAITEDSYQTYQKNNHPHPVLEYAFHWLRENRPSEDMELRLVHGDFRNGNIMVGPDGLRAALDWELAHIGDPMQDLAFISINSWRFGNIDLPVGGFGTREEFFDAYSSVSGKPVDEQRVLYWEVLLTLKWGCDCMSFTELFRTANPTIERAAIGRRTSETEVDLLRILAPRKKKG